MKVNKKKFFKATFINIFWGTTFVIMLVSIYVSRESPNTEPTVTRNLKLERQMEKMKKLLRDDYNSYGKDIGLNGYDACKRYMEKERSVCDLIYGVKK